MRDASLFLLKNSLGSKMKKGLRNFCNDDGSTSTLNQHACGTSSRPMPSPLGHHDDNFSVGPGSVNVDSTDDRVDQEMERQPTLEEMILKLDLEEEIARKSKALQLMKDDDRDDYKVDDMNGILMRGPGRMSCVNNSDILRSARNALNQYPRFSLDGRDAMYRSSFRNSLHTGRPAHRDHRFRSSDVCSSISHEYFDASSSTTRSSYRQRLPATIAGESVIWCRPGVVAKLMGIDAMPVPLSVAGKFKASTNERLRYILKQSQRNMATMRGRGDQQRHEMDKISMMHNTPAARNCRRFSNCKKGKDAAASATSTAGSCSTTSKTTPLVTTHHTAFRS